ncbi:MAG TPA: (d)CMP kinase [Acidimicrobiia bacterium]|nr:(d)CMP kinase [Acidimicrobiia bacterium]
MTVARVVAIDGPAGSGKSTVARRVAEVLGLPALDTGAMYRALTWAVLDQGIDPSDAAAVAALAGRLDLEVGPPVLVGGRDVNDAIRTADVSAAVSLVAAVPEARVILVRAQREWIAIHGGGVVEGRDIGTVVAPDALLKIYLVASEEERARRRQEQDGTTEASGDLDATKAAIRRRDAIDSGRAVSPLAAADDAVVLDTTGLSVEGVVDEVVRRYRAALDAAERT